MQYPDVTAEEEEASIPLQMLCLAIFDGALVHILGALAPSSWQVNALAPLVAG